MSGAPHALTFAHQANGQERRYFEFSVLPNPLGKSCRSGNFNPAKLAAHGKCCRARNLGF
jgi:hypothetical protein